MADQQIFDDLDALCMIEGTRLAKEEPEEGHGPDDCTVTADDWENSFDDWYRQLERHAHRVEIDFVSDKVSLHRDGVLKPANVLE